MAKEKTFTFDVERIFNGYLISHNGKKVYRELSSEVNTFIDETLRVGMIAHVVASYPKGTAQRLVVTVGIEGKVME